MVVHPTFQRSSPAPNSCQALSIINGVLLVLSYVGWAGASLVQLFVQLEIYLTGIILVFLAWRAYALSSSSASVGMLVFICGVAFASPSLVRRSF